MTTTDPVRAAAPSGPTPAARTGATAVDEVRPSGLVRALRWFFAGVLLLCAATLFVTWTRAVPTEAVLTSGVLSRVFGGAAASGDVIWTGIGSPQLFGIELTPLCSTVVLLIPVFLFGGLLVLWLTKAPLWRALVGVAVGLVLAVAANQIRFVLLVALWRWFGLGGFQVGHRYVGSVEVLVVFALAMFAMLRIATGGRRRSPARPGGHGGGPMRAPAPRPVAPDETPSPRDTAEPTSAHPREDHLA